MVAFQKTVFLSSPTDNLSLPAALLMLLSPSLGATSTWIRAREHHVTQKKPRKGVWCWADNFNLHRGCLRWSTACKHKHQAQSSAGITCEDGKHHQTTWSTAELRQIRTPAWASSCALIDGRGGWTQMAKGLPCSSWCDLSGSCLKDIPGKERGRKGGKGIKKGMK